MRKCKKSTENDFDSNAVVRKITDMNSTIIFIADDQFKYSVIVCQRMTNFSSKMAVWQKNDRFLNKCVIDLRIENSKI